MSDEEKEAKKRKAEYAATMPKPRTSDAFREGDKFRFDKMKDLIGVNMTSKKI